MPLYSGFPGPPISSSPALAVDDSTDLGPGVAGVIFRPFAVGFPGYICQRLDRDYRSY